MTYQRRGEKYRTLLTDREKAKFKELSRTGMSPRDICPMCGGMRLTKETTSRFDRERLDFVNHATQVDCHTCKVRYSVLLPKEARV